MTNSLVSTKWLSENLGDPNLRLIEINWDGTTSYDEGHIEGAIGWNWKSALWDPYERQFPDQHLFSERLSQIGANPDTKIVFYGVPVQFGTYAWWVFRMCGHQNVAMLDGTKTKWLAENRPITTTRPSINPTNYKAGNRNENIRASRKDVLGSIGSNITILDHRSFEEYQGERVGLPGKPDVGAERAGRIPGAKHIPFDSLLNEDDTFKSVSELEEIILPHVANKNAKVVSYCRLAHRATLASFVMTEILGFNNVRVYDGSWTEWGSLVGVPIER